MVMCFKINKKYKKMRNRKQQISENVRKYLKNNNNFII